MAKLTRKLQKIFGSTAGANQIGVFGSLAASDPTTTTDPEVVQSLANYLEGWYGAVLGDNSPAIEDMNAVHFLYAYQLAYLFQEGIPEWNSATTYYTGSMVNVAGDIKVSLQDTNLNHATSDGAWWVSLFQPINDQITAIKAQERTDKEIQRRQSVRFWRKGTMSDDLYTAVAWSPSLHLFCAVAFSGSNGQVATSPDGFVWTLRSAAAANQWLSIAWSPTLNLFAAVSGNGTNRVMTSPDGITWTSRSAASALGWGAITWAPALGLFCAVATTNAGTSGIMTSPDGINWTSRTTPSSYVGGICWSEELHLFVSPGVNSSSALTSPDGITWTLRTLPSSKFWFGAVWCAKIGLFVISASNNSATATIATSPDGINWTARNGAAGCFSAAGIAWSPELEVIVIVCSNVSSPTYFIESSADGINWYAQQVDAAITGGLTGGLVWSPERSLFVAPTQGAQQVALSL